MGVFILTSPGVYLLIKRQRDDADVIGRLVMVNYSTISNIRPVKIGKIGYDHSMLDWFPKSKDDKKFLDHWEYPDSNFNPNQPTDSTWYVDMHEIHLGLEDNSREYGLFDRAVELLYRYQFYPETIMEHVSDFEYEGRRPQLGDRIVQRVHAIKGILDVISMTRISGLLFEQYRKGLTYVTTNHHLEMGEWTATIVKKKDNHVVLIVQAVSKHAPSMPFWAKPFARMVQLRAHRLGIANFRKLVHKNDRTSVDLP